MHGFLQGGYIDKKKLRFPDFNKILSTCRRNPTLDEYELCKTSFHGIMKLYLQDGHVCDNVFEDLGFPMDRDPIGNQVRRKAGITQEMRQRAKILTHSHQCELRKSINFQ